VDCAEDERSQHVGKTVAAIVTHLRVRDHSFGLAAVFVLLAVAALVLRLASLQASSIVK
jgi:hypothetical protein